MVSQNIECQNTSCHIAEVCRIKDRAHNCAIHRAFKRGEKFDETMIAERYYSSKNGEEIYILSVRRATKCRLEDSGHLKAQKILNTIS